MDEQHIIELLRNKPNGRLYHREGQELEFKEQFNLAGLADYFRNFAAFSNNKGGYLIFGVKDSPRQRMGLSDKSKEQFESIDPEKITGFLLEIFSSAIEWEQSDFVLGNQTFGVFKISEAVTKPVIAKKDEGKDQIIRNGDIYYRYGGRTQRIQFAELEAIIRNRIDLNNKLWMDLLSKIGKAGPQNAAILDLERSSIEKGSSQILVIDDVLASKLKFIREGNFSEKKGAETLKLVGDVMPVNQVEVVKHVKENLLKEYPLSAMNLLGEIKKRVPGVKARDVWAAVQENGLKTNQIYAAYNFRNRAQEERFDNTGNPGANPAIYNYAAVDFVEQVIRNQMNEMAE